MTHDRVSSLLDLIAADTPRALVLQAQETLWKLRPDEGSEAAEVLATVDRLLSSALEKLEAGS